MKLNTIKIWLFATLLIGFTACESDDDSLADPYVDDTEASTANVNYSSGSADFSTFVAVGNSLTAGFSDGALFAKGQDVSFPNILAQQFALAGGGTFTQPLMNDDVGGLLSAGAPIAPPRFIFDATSQTPVLVSGTPSTDIASPIPGPYNNMGVPGAKTFHLLAPGYGDIGNFPAAANPFFIRMASSPSVSVLDDATAMNPTFFSLWIGNNDVLGYATTGGDGTDPITPSAGGIGAGFDATYAAIAALVSNNGATKGIIANIPNVTDAPFFTTVPFNALDPTDNPALESQIAALNAQLYGPLDVVFTAFGEPDRVNMLSTTAANPVLIHDENATDMSAQITGALTPVLGAATAAAFGSIFGKARQATASDLILLTASGEIGAPVTGAPAPVNVNGISYPLSDSFVLLPQEQQEIATATTAFNQTIAATATALDLAFFDVNTFFNGVATTGLEVGSTTMTADFVTGGTFSLDGVHPSPRGYAVVANEMLKIINAKYGSNIPGVNPIDYTGVYLD